MISIKFSAFVFILMHLNVHLVSCEDAINTTLVDEKLRATITVISEPNLANGTSGTQRSANETLKSSAQQQNPYVNQRNQAPGVGGVLPFVPFLGPVLNSLSSARQGGAYSPQTLAAARQRGAQPGAGLNPFGILNIDNFIPGGATPNNAARQRANQGAGLFGQPAIPQSEAGNDASTDGESQPEEESADGQGEAQGNQEPNQDPNNDPDIQQFQNLRGSNFPADLFPPGVLSQADIADIQKGIEEQQKREAEKQRQQEAEQEQPEDESGEGNDASEGEEAEKDTGKDHTTEEPQSGNERDAIGNKRNLPTPYGTPHPLQPLTPSPIRPQSPYSPLPPGLRGLTPLTGLPSPNPRDLYGRGPQTNRNPYPDYDYDRPQPRRRDRRPGVLYRNDEPAIPQNYNNFDRRQPPRPNPDDDYYRYPRRDEYAQLPRRGAERSRSRIQFDDDDEVNAYRRLPRRPVTESQLDRDYIRRREDQLLRRRLAARDDPRRFRPEFGGQGQYSNVKVNSDTGASAGVSYDDENSINNTLPYYPSANYYGRQLTASNHSQQINPTFHDFAPGVEYVPRQPKFKFTSRDNLSNHRLTDNHGNVNSQTRHNPSSQQPYIPPYSPHNYQRNRNNYPETNINAPVTNIGDAYTGNRQNTRFGFRKSKSETANANPNNQANLQNFGPVTPPAFLPFDPSYDRFINGNYRQPNDERANSNDEKSNSEVEYDADNDVGNVANTDNRSTGNRDNRYVTRNYNVPNSAANTAQSNYNQNNRRQQPSTTSKQAQVQRNARPFLNA